MKLLLPPEIVQRLRAELRRGKSREIGGVLVGEHIGGDVFRVVDLSVQLTGGTAAHFVRDPQHHQIFLDDFFARTGQDFTRFNYIGEWHSHPAFAPVPSTEDRATMINLIQDPAVGVNFAVLIIARLRRRSNIELSATLFQIGQSPTNVEVELESEERAPEPLLRRLYRVFTGR